MSDLLELKTFHRDSQEENEIEEYHEIETENIHEHLIKQQTKSENPTDLEFFIETNVKSSKKTKKKKGKNKNDKSLMDIITSELAAHESPVTETIINEAEPTKGLQLLYLQRTPHFLERYQNSWQWRRDTEWGKNFGVNLNPVFANISQNTITVNDVKPHYVQPKVFDDLISNIDNYSTDQIRFLDIEIRNLKFKYHHNFSLEKLLATKLVDTFNEYQKVITAIQNIEKEIRVNRDTKNNLKSELIKISPKKESVRFDPTIRKYTGQMLELKPKYLKEIKKQTEILNMVVSLWSDIELVREKTKTVKTPYILDMFKKNIDKDEIDKEWQVVFNTEFTDLLDREEYCYISKYLDYKQQKHEVKSGNTKKNMLKPKLEIDEAQIKEEAEIVTKEITKKNGIEIDLKIEDKLQGKIVKSDIDAVTFNCYFKVFVDDAFVCESELYSGKNIDFRVHEYLSVQILPHNVLLTIVLYENNSQISSLKIKLSDIKKKKSLDDFSKAEFTMNSEIPATTKTIGSGNTIKEIASTNKLRLKSSNIFKGNLYTHCETYLKVCWNDQLNQSNHDIVKQIKDTEGKIGRILNGVEEPTFDTVKDLIEKVYDKDIEDDEEILSQIETLCKQRVDTNTHFLINEDSPDFIRIKLLLLRNKGEFSDMNNKLVPLYPSQISTEQLSCLQKSNLKLDANHLKGEKYSEMHPIELQRFIGAKYVEGLNKNMMKNLNDNLLKKTYRDVVMDFQDLSLRSLFSSFSKPLPSYNVANNNDKEAEIYITVYRAFNLPERTTPILPDERGDREDSIAGFKLRSLRPYVKVYCQGNSAQSTIAIGCHPTWNQTLKISVNPSRASSLHINIFDEHKSRLDNPDDSYQGTIQFRCHNQWLGCLNVPLKSILHVGKLRGTFKINMPSLLLGYEDMLKAKETSSFIPQLTQLLKKESSFIALQITTNMPPIANHFIPVPNDPDDYVIKHLNMFLTEYKTEFPSRNFHLTFIDSGGKNRCVTQYLQPIVLPDFVLKNAKRSDSAKSSNTKSSSSKSVDLKRNVDVEKGLGTDVESLYSTYERGSKLDELDKIINCVLRYVSLIPTYDVTEDHIVTLMGVELLRMLHGSALDHTILLASYFLYLGLKTYVVVGLGLPRGQSSFVLTKYDLKTRKMVLKGQMNGKGSFMSRNDGLVWNLYDAVKGERFELRDVGCPLKTVDYIFDNENIWVNIQTSQECESVSFDLTKSSEWQPVFDKNIFVMEQPILSDSSLYKQPADVEQLRNALENRIKTKMQKWRSHKKTIWNRYCSTVLRESLPSWEYWSLCPTEARPVFGHRLKQMMLTYKVYGFPLNLPYSNTKTVISTVKSTGVHINDDPHAEFGLAVQVYAYPNNVLSVWVFLASIVRI